MTISTEPVNGARSEFLSRRHFDDLMASASALLRTRGSGSSAVTDFFFSQRSRRKALLTLSATEAATETALRKQMDRALSLAAPLGMQARYLCARLEGCIDASESDVAGLRSQMDALELMSEALEDEERDVADALQFVVELAAQQDVQTDRAAANARTVELSDQLRLARLLHRVRAAQSDANACYTLVALRCRDKEATSRELQKANEQLCSVPLEVAFVPALSSSSCSSSKSVGHGDGGSDEGKGSDGGDDGDRQEDICCRYDHAECSDCRIVAQLARECASRMRHTQMQAHESFARLQALLRVREDLFALAAQLNVEL